MSEERHFLVAHRLPIRYPLECNGWHDTSLKNLFFFFVYMKQTSQSFFETAIIDFSGETASYSCTQLFFRN